MLTQHNYRHLIIICVIQIFIIIVLALFHLIPNCPLPWGCMSIIHWIIGITGRTNIRSGSKTSCTKGQQIILKIKK